MDVTNYFPGDQIDLEDLGGGIRRKVTAFNDNLMSVEVHFDKGSVAALHSHPHEQITYVMSGRLEFKVGDATYIVSAGESLYKQPDIVHGATCLEAGVLLDFFTPHRAGFL